MQNSIYSRALFLIGSVLTAVTVAITAWNAFAERQDLTAQLETRLRQLTILQAKSVSDSLWNLNRESTLHILGSLNQDPDFFAASVRTDKGSLFVRIGNEVLDADSVITNQLPIFIDDGGTRRRIGSLELSLSRARLLERQNLSLRDALINGLAQLVAVLTVTALTLRWIIVPIERITRRLTRLASGDTDTPIPALDRDDQIGAMARAVGTFRKSLIEIRSLRAEDAEKARMLARARAETEAANRALVASEERFRNFAETSSDWFWELDENLRFSYFSDRFTEITGVPQEALLGKTREETGIPGVDPKAWRRHLADLGANRPFRDFVHPREHPERGTVFLSINGRPIFDENGTFKGYRGTGSDITREMKTLQALRNAKEDAEYANRAKTEFLAHMSHELRTPLNSIIGFAQMLVSGIPAPLKHPKQEEYAKDIEGSGRHLLEVINDILDISRIEAGETNVDDSDVDVHEVVRSSLRMVGERAANHGIELTTDIPDDLPLLRADSRFIKQIMLNLLSNAVKFTPDEKTITVGAKVDDRRGMALFVQDTGVGIAAEDIPKALEPFAIVESAMTRTHEGAGLGLSLCKHLAELHGGSLEIDSLVGKGTTVTVHFPAERVVGST